MLTNFPLSAIINIESKRDVGFENARVDTRLSPNRHQIKILKNFQKTIDNLIKKCYNNNVNKNNI